MVLQMIRTNIQISLNKSIMKKFQLENNYLQQTELLLMTDIECLDCNKIDAYFAC